MDLPTHMNDLNAVLTLSAATFIAYSGSVMLQHRFCKWATCEEYSAATG